MPDELHELEPHKPSKLDRIKSAAVVAGWIIIPVTLTAGTMYASYKMSSMQLETAKLNLESAKRLTQ